MAKKRKRVLTNTPHPTAREVAKEMGISKKKMRQIEKALDRLINKNTVTLSLFDAYRFLLYAMRYAVGRKSGVVGWTCRQVRSIAPKLAPFQIDALIESIQRCENYDTKYDKQAWLELLGWLKNLK